MLAGSWVVPTAPTAPAPSTVTTRAPSTAATPTAAPTATPTAAVSYASDTVTPAPLLPPPPPYYPRPRHHCYPTATVAPTTAPAPWVVRHRLGGSVYAYISPAGYWVVVDTCTRIVLKVEYDLGFGVLGGWVLGFWGGVGVRPRMLSRTARL